MDGLLLFVKYALPPNQRQFCGPAKTREIFEYWRYQQSDAGLRQLLREFTGAYPYLQFIAQQNQIADPFDPRVVEAYWIGNSLLKNISTSRMAQMLKERFQSRISPGEMNWLLTKVPAGAKPHHSLHVFDLYHRLKEIQGGELGLLTKVIDECRIGWGKVLEVGENQLVVEYRPILIHQQQLKFGSPQPKTVVLPLGNRENYQVNEWVSFHWSQVCDRLSAHQLKNLRYWTNFHRRLANLTL